MAQPRPHRRIESEVEAPAGSTPWDYFHINSIEPDSDGNLLISARSTWAGYLLERDTGKVLWRLGGNKSSFEMGPGTRWPGSTTAACCERRSDLLRRRLEPADPPPVAWRADQARPEAREAHLVSAYTHPDPPLLAASQGNMQTLRKRQHAVGYGGVPRSASSPGRLAALRRPSAV